MCMVPVQCVQFVQCVISVVEGVMRVVRKEGQAREL